MSSETAAIERPTDEQTNQEHRRREPALNGDAPPGWSYNPSAWSQRLPIAGIALANCVLACYLAACEMGFFRHAWDPFFGSGADRVLGSSISRSFPVPDAALGAAIYLLEAICCLIGDARRWKTKPWLALTFGILVAPLFAVSLVLLMLQPIAVRAWCTLCLVIAAGMLVMVPLALDEVAAAIQFLIETVHDGKPVWHTLWRGAVGTPVESEEGRFESRPFQGLSIPWSLAACVVLGIWLMVSPVALHTRGAAATSAYISGALVIAVSMLASAEVARTVRLVAAAVGVWLLVFAPWSLMVTGSATRPAEVLAGVLIIVCCAPRGRVRERYGRWDRWIV